jgi:hypothetical protein
MAPQSLSGYRLRVVLPRWRADQTAAEAVHCMNCQERTVAPVRKIAWARNVKVAGGGISFDPTQSNVDLAELLNAITLGGTAPRAVWLVPEGVPIPKTAPPQLAGPPADAKQGGSQIHPLVEFEFAHNSQVGTSVLSVLKKPSWASSTQFKPDTTNVARLSIADRKYASLTPLLHDFRAAGRIPREIRLREFGDIRIQINFSHICGDIDYSKPPKPKPKKKSKKKTEKKSEKKPVKSKPTKPFVPKALRPAGTNNGRRKIEAAVASVEWIKNALFYDFHTKPQFNGPLKMTIALQIEGEDVVRIDQLIKALRDAGFPPKSVLVSRRFAGIPFGKPLPGDLQLTKDVDKQLSLASLKKPGRPLVVAFVALKSSRYKKYKPEPQYYGALKATIDKYQDRVDFHAVSANKDDKFSDVADFWAKTATATLPLLHDADGSVRAAFNVQITPAPHIFVFDAEGKLRYAGDAHDNWESPDKPQDDYLAKALDLVLVGKYLANGAVFYNKSVCNCSHPMCKCPKCGCGSTCRCAVKHCGVGF